METPMFAPYRSLATSYRNLDLETSVQDASPHKLVALLYDGAIGAILRARAAMQSGDVAGKGKAISPAIRIVDEGLKASLDSRAGEIATNLRDLYDYMGRRLLWANLHDDDEVLQEVAMLLGQLRTGWSGIAPEGRSAPNRAVTA